jgi:hypothetical protein
MSENIRQRIMGHVQKLKKGNHPSELMQQEFYNSPDSFKCEVLELGKRWITERERKWITKMSPLFCRLKIKVYKRIKSKKPTRVYITIRQKGRKSKTITVYGVSSGRMLAAIANMVRLWKS